MNIEISEDNELILQLDQNESDKLCSIDEHDRAAVFHEIYNQADDFFSEWDEVELPVLFDVGVPFGILRCAGVGQYNWKR